MVVGACLGREQLSPVARGVSLAVVACAVVDSDDLVLGHQGDLQLGQPHQVEGAHGLDNDRQYLLEGALSVIVTVALEQGQQEDVEKLCAGISGPM